MPRAAIVSSYNEECGAAFFSSRLKHHLEKSGLAVDVLRLPVSLLRISYPSEVRKRGDREIARIAGQLGAYDAVYLQFEPGLYGNYRTAYPRVLQLLKAARKAVITVHGFDRVSAAVPPLKALLDGDGRLALRSVVDVSRHRAVTGFWHTVERLAHVQIITFCKADQALLERMYGLTRVNNYPITYFDSEETSTIRAGVDRGRLLTQYGLDPSKTYFGVCGFLSPYKGHLTAIKALEFLPEDWCLVVVGGEHPHALEPDKDMGNYVRQLLAFTLESDEKRQNLMLQAQKGDLSDSLARADMDRMQLQAAVFKRSEFKYFFPEDSVRDRVKFVGQVSDEAMPQFYCALDYIVHPYIRTRSGQSGSGPATMAVEFGARSLFSNAPVFREMERYFENAMSFFNIGNFVELAEGMQRLDNFWPALSQNRARALEKYNPRGMVELYRSCMGI
jgi:glycosyltransferase involved in cell wall biosynthesis